MSRAHSRSLLVSWAMFAVAVSVFAYSIYYCVNSGSPIPILVCKNSNLMLGTLPVGHVKKISFRIQNIGSGMGEILGSEAECGCTSLDDVKQTIAPSAFADIYVAIIPSGIGHQERRIILHTSDRSHPIITIYVSYTIES